MECSSPEPARSPGDVVRYYSEAFDEGERLTAGVGQLELVRTQELLARYLSPPPAVVYDVGGGTGVYSLWLAEKGYEVHLVDAVPRHIERAGQLAETRPRAPLASLAVGDARHLDRADESVDAVLLFGPLYHLTQREERLAALRDARRILRAGGVLLAVGISRFASAVAGLFWTLFDDPEYGAIVERDLRDGQHRNHTGRAEYFTTAYFHEPKELAAELEDAGLEHVATVAIEGPGWLLTDFDRHWESPARRAQLLDILRRIEQEPSLLGGSAHLLVVGRKSRRELRPT